MNKTFILLFALVALAGSAFGRPELKPRVIVLTDLKRFQEVDDSESIVRLLAHADLVEIEGIIVTSGMNYWEPAHAIGGYEYSFELLQAYEKSVGNLMKLSGQKTFEPVEDVQPIGYWPSPRYLTQRTVLGTALQGLDQTGPGKANAGSRLIADVVDENDPRPVYLLLWGGPNVLAQTMRDLTENPATRRSPEAVAAFVRKLRVIAVGDQDQPWSRRADPPIPNNAGRWLREQFPDLSWLLANGAGFQASTRDRQPFYRAHIQGHGALGDAYPDHHYACEGDTPSLLHVLPLGLADLAHPDGGTPTGAYVFGANERLRAKLWSRSKDDPIARYGDDLAQRVSDALWYLFAARMDWVRAGTGNRPPTAIVDGDDTLAVLRRTAAAGETVTLDASASRDDENDRLTFAWEQMLVPGAYGALVPLGSAKSSKLSFQVPADASGRDVHLLLTVEDHGAGHSLSAWRHVVVTVR